MRWPGTDFQMGQEGHSQREGGVAEKGGIETLGETRADGEVAPIPAVRGTRIVRLKSTPKRPLIQRRNRSFGALSAPTAFGSAASTTTAAATD